MPEIKSFLLKCLRPFALDGAIVKAGDLVEVAENEARNLLHRARAELVEDDGPTRTQLDLALAALPGDQTDVEYVVNGMRSHFGDLFTDEDEAAVRELVKAK